VAILLLSLRPLFKAENAVPFVIAISIGIVAQLVVLCFLASDKKTTSIAIAQSLTVLFLILIGTHLSSAGEPSVRLRTGRLFWGPLAAMAVWINAASSGWRKTSQIIFIILLVQVSIGFIDMGAMQNATWIWVCAASFFLIAFGFVIGWAEQLNK
jgi:hypothetical protein